MLPLSCPLVLQLPFSLVQAQEWQQVSQPSLHLQQSTHHGCLNEL